MNELGRLIRSQVRKAVKDGQASGTRRVAAAVNIGGQGHSSAVYTDDEVTIVTTDGQTDVLPHEDAPRSDPTDQSPKAP